MAACQENFGRECMFYEDFGSGNPSPGWHWAKGILAETAILIVVYRVLFFIMLKPVVKHLYKRNKSTWQYMTTYKGICHKNVHVEVVYLTILSIHHIIGGGMMLYGWKTSNPALWAQGAIVDLADAIHDTVLMIAPLWPFDDRDPKLLQMMIPHHLCALVITLPAICNGMHEMEDAQLIGASLLLAGGMTDAIVCLTRTRDRRDPVQAWQEAIGWLTNTIFYTYCRFYIFPICAYNILSTTWADMESYMQICSVLVLVSMTFFNVNVGISGLRVTVNRLTTAINGGAKDKK